MTISKSFLGVVFKVSFLSGLASLLFFGVELLIAFRLGISPEADAFFVALVIPRVLYALGVSIGSALVPVFVPEGQEPEEVNTLYTSVFNVALLILSLIVIFGLLLAPLLVAVISPGLSVATSQQATGLIRIILPSALFAGLATILMGMLNAHELFAQAALSNLARAVATVAGMALLMGYGAAGLGLGWLLGNLVQLLVTLIICTRRQIFRYRPRLVWRDPALAEAWVLTRTALWSRGARQLEAIFEKVIGSFLPPGTIAALNYAMNFVRMGGGLAIQIVAQVSLPQLTTEISQNKLEEAHQLFSRNLRFVTYLIFPIVIMLMILSEPLSTLLLQRGTVTAAQVERIASLLSLASVWLIFQVFFQFSIVYLYARRLTRVISWSFFILSTVYVLFGWLIGPYSGGKGLILASIFALIPGIIYSMRALQLPPVQRKVIIDHTVRLFTTAVITGGVTWEVIRILSTALTMLPTMGQAGLTLIIGLLVIATVWLGITAALGVPETLTGLRAVRFWAQARFRQLEATIS